MSGPISNEIADLAQLIELLAAPFSNKSVKKDRMSGTEFLKGSKLFSEQNFHHFFKYVSYCLKDDVVMEDNMISVDDSGIPLDFIVCLTSDRPQGYFCSKIDLSPY